MADDYAYEAELLLSMAGAPETKEQMLIAAQTKAIIALVRTLRPEAPPVKHTMPRDVVDIFLRCGYTAVHGASFARQVVANEPNWQVKKIQAIKDLRTITNMGLKEAKDVVEAMDRDVLKPWW